ncbi:MAG: tetratricopeptide repeat protein, partial [Caldilineae bacterium]
MDGRRREKDPICTNTVRPSSFVLRPIPFLFLLLGLVFLAACGGDRTATPTPPQVQAVPTYTPTPAAIAAGEQPRTAQKNDAGSARPPEVPTPTPTATPTPPPTPAPDERLAQAAHLHRYGYYTDEQWMLLGLLADPNATSAQRLTARYRLAESYLAEDNFALALETLDAFQLEAVALPEDDPRRSNSLFLRAEALAGLGRASEAAAAYLTFLETHPALTGVVQELVAEAWLAANEQGRAAAALRAAADATEDRVERVRLLERMAGVLEAGERWQEAAD